MPWLSVEYDCGNCIIVKKYFSSRYGKKDIVYTPQTGKHASEGQMSVYKRNMALKYSILVNANFKEGDYFITYTFARGKLPADEETIKKAWAKYRRKLRLLYQKKGIELKYVYSYEHEGVRPHFHFICNNEIEIPLKTFPKWEYGNPQIKMLDDRKYHSIGEYFSKGDLGCSRNLYRPKPKVTELCGSAWPENPRGRKDYYVDKDSIENGYTEIPDGRMYRSQIYRLIKMRS